MFENEIEYIYKYNLNKIEHLGSFITYEQLLSTNIHPALLQYLSAEIDFLIYEDRQKLLKESLFDYSGDKIVEYFTNIGEEIKRTKKFSYEYLSKLLLHASSFNVNFIIRPKWSLVQFVFENKSEPTKQIVEIKQILNYLYYYPYLKRLLINFFDKKRMVTISNSEFVELLDKIDKINYESNFDKVVDNALISIAEFMYMGEVKNKKVSKYFVELFLADKGLSHFKIILDEKFGSGSTDKFEISEFKNVILSYDSQEDLEIEESVTEEKHDNVLNSEETSTSSSVESNISEKESTLPIINIIESDVIENNREEEDLSTNEAIDDLNETEPSEKDNSTEEKKSFLESHFENLEGDVENIEDNLDEDISREEKHEPPELDEAPRVDEENIDEVYELATEEEKLDSFIEDEETPLPRIEIDDDENPFQEMEDIDGEENSTTENVTDEEKNISNENSFVEQGASITFNSDELASKVQLPSEDNESEEEVNAEVEEWPSESSLNSENNSDVIPNLATEEDFSEDINSTEVMGETDSEVMDEMEKLLEEETVIEKENDTDNSEITDNQQMLFNEEYLNDISNIEENSPAQIVEPTSESELAEDVDEQSIDISVLLENKKITKIIEVVFDYDMEEFAVGIDKISECRSEIEAHDAIDEIAKRSYIDPSVKEIKIFKNIISDFFE